MGKEGGEKKVRKAKKKKYRIEEELETRKR